MVQNEKNPLHFLIHIETTVHFSTKPISSSPAVIALFHHFVFAIREELSSFLWGFYVVLNPRLK